MSHREWQLRANRSAERRENALFGTVGCLVLIWYLFWACVMIAGAVIGLHYAVKYW